MTTDHATIHDYLATGDDHQRGYYMGLVKTLFYAQAQVAKGPMVIQLELSDAGYGYSPTGEARHAASFYEPDPPQPEGMVWHQFDPVYLYCMWMELDSEGRIYEIHQELQETKYGRYVQIRVACTEDAEGPGVPDDFPHNAWQELAEMRDRIRELDKWNTAERGIS